MSDTQLHDSAGDDLLIQSPIHQMESRRKQRSRSAWLGLGILMIGSVLVVGQQGGSFMASILPIKQAPVFDGTVYPIEKVPNYVKLKSAEYKYSYEQLTADEFIPTPVYNALNLALPVEGLKWGNPSDDAIRNQKITYPVPYMGSYRLNGKEYDGSHLAIDIKVPQNTPVRSIANGVVVKVGYQATGFGKHIVIQHTNVPSVENPNVLTTYYSSYSHLSNTLVSEGDVVLRGQNIGLSGQTGFATTPHVHFQIDRVDAPWHPFWPFTYAEQVAAGTDFVGALNMGLGQAKAIATTVNPMTFVQQNLTGTPIIANNAVSYSSTPAPVAPVVTPAPIVPAPVVAPVVTPAVPATSTNTDTAASAPVVNFSFLQKTMYQVGEEVKITISAQDQNGNPVNTLDDSALILLSGDIGTLSRSSFTSGDLSGGTVMVQIQGPKVGQAQLTVLYKGVQTKSDAFTIINPTPTPAPVISAPTANRPVLFADVSGMSSLYDAIKYVKEKGVFGGYQDGTFKPDQVISRVEVLKVALKAANRQILPTQGALSYIDIDPTAWYIPFIATAQQNGITQGYIGGHFKPNQNVTRAEFLKILLMSTPVSLNPYVNSAPYPDVKTDDWFAVFAQFAQQKNLLPNTNLFNGNEEITRGEVAEITYRLLVILSSGSNAYTAGLANG